MGKLVYPLRLSIEAICIIQGAPAKFEQSDLYDLIAFSSQSVDDWKKNVKQQKSLPNGELGGFNPSAKY